MPPVLIIVLGVVVIFAITVFVGPPYVRSHKRPVESALGLFELKKGDRLLDLGSGDGAVLLAAAKRGVIATGYEINPVLWLVSLWRTRKYRSHVRIKWGDMWRVSINDRTPNVYMFLDVRFIKRIDKKIMSSGAKVRLVSYSYKIPGKKIRKSKDGMYLYEYNGSDDRQ